MKKNQRLLHTISFRLADEDYLKLEEEVKKTRLTPHDWCRDAALEKLNPEEGMSKNERMLFEQFLRTHYLVANGFQLLADDKLTSEEWKKFRTFAKEKVDVIAERALADFRSRRSNRRQESSPDVSHKPELKGG
ncbi:MAG TPA: hypothetical protein VMM84_18030 [Pyrinomonadaceae bacterium]|nr:hypothetical protein [Pyrinomonadaceae bacterium]